MSSKLLTLFVVCSGFIIQDSQSYVWKEETCSYEDASKYLNEQLFQDEGSFRTKTIKKIPTNPTRKDFNNFLDSCGSATAPFEETASELREIPLTGGNATVRKAFDNFYTSGTEINKHLTSRIKNKQYFGSESFLIQYWDAIGQNMKNLQNTVGKGKNKVADCYGDQGTLYLSMIDELKKLNIQCVNTKDQLKKYLDIVTKYYKKLNDAVNCKL